MAVYVPVVRSGRESREGTRVRCHTASTQYGVVVYDICESEFKRVARNLSLNQGRVSHIACQLVAAVSSLEKRGCE